jgi:hypothetical protein
LGITVSELRRSGWKELPRERKTRAGLNMPEILSALHQHRYRRSHNAEREMDIRRAAGWGV